MDIVAVKRLIAVDSLQNDGNGREGLLFGGDAPTRTTNWFRCIGVAVCGNICQTFYPKSTIIPASLSRFSLASILPDLYAASTVGR
jgi:hypothetical protein